MIVKALTIAGSDPQQRIEGPGRTLDLGDGGRFGGQGEPHVWGFGHGWQPTVSIALGSHPRHWHH